MLLLADRNFAGYELWGLVTAAGADIAWRIKKNLVLPPVKVLPDGSFLSIMPTPAESLRHWQARARGKPLRRHPRGHLIRVIEYTVTVATADGRTRTEAFRLATTLLDDKQAPAAQLAAVYHQRWEIVSCVRNMETSSGSALPSGGAVGRSQEGQNPRAGQDAQEANAGGRKGGLLEPSCGESPHGRF
jgi:hypothetical protein